MKTITELLASIPTEGEAFRPADEHKVCKAHGEYLSAKYVDGAYLCVSPACPVCAAEARNAKLLEGAAIPARFADMTIRSWLPEGDAQERIKTIGGRYVSDVDKRCAEGTNLLLLGGVGTGKTHLACGIGHAFIAQGRAVKYIRARDMIGLLRDTWRRDSEKTERQVLTALWEVDLLIVDEVGAQFDTDAERQQLFDVFDGRYERMNPTIVVSNLSASGLMKAIGERSFDRLRHQSAVLTFDWESQR